MNTAKSTLDNAKAEMEAIEANIKQAEIEVNTAETKWGYTKITAPMDGTVVSVPVSEGQTVNANQTTPTIVTIADLSKMKIKPEISEGDITKVKAGQEVSFTIYRIAKRCITLSLILLILPIRQQLIALQRHLRQVQAVVAPQPVRFTITLTY